MAALVLFVSAALATAALIRLAMPLLRRYALARPNARSSHREPTPQGGGGPVVLVAVLALAGAAALGLAAPQPFHAVLACGALALALVGAADDMRPLPAKLRLALQALVAAAALIAAPDHWRVAPFLPLALERIVALVAIVWFVNLTNFMDGIDGITVAEIAPLAGALAVFGVLSDAGTVLALALAGALLGFLVFNRPPATVFLGDVGSLPIGLLLAALLLEGAAKAGPIPMLILPMYYLYDATSTLLMRARRGENLFEAHRHHAYQHAVDGGWSAAKVDVHVLGLNAGLIGLAALAMVVGQAAQALLLALALAATILVCRRFRSAGKGAAQP